MVRLTCLFSLLCVLVTAESSCHKRKVVVAPPAVLPVPQREPPVTQPDLPPPPQIPPAETPAVTLPAPQGPTTGPPVEPRPPRRQPRPAGNPQVAPPATVPSAPPPQLGLVLTADEQRQYNSAIDQSLQRAQGSIQAIGNRQLTKEQQANLEEVQNFVRQAQATRGTDLPGARRLAERAEVLARNLASSLR